MRVLLKVGYTSFLLGPNAGPEFFKALDGAAVVEEKGAWNEPKKYEIQSNSRVEVTLISDDSLTLPEASNEAFEQFHKVATERDELKKKVKELEEKVKGITQAVAA